jgi:hypothetical protein
MITFGNSLTLRVYHQNDTIQDHVPNCVDGQLAATSLIAAFHCKQDKCMNNDECPILSVYEEMNDDGYNCNYSDENFFLFLA